MVAYSTLLLSFIATVAASQAGTQDSAEWEPRTLLARQSSNGLPDPSQIPDQCKDKCTSATNTATSPDCASISCICSDKFSNSLSSCLQCAIDAVGQQSFVSSAQTAYNSYAGNCADLDQPVQNVTFTLHSGSGRALGNNVHVLSAGLIGSLVFLLS
ncbi:hypothetical protein D9756_008276 [Leucocoprinus leucothites]|uniref:Extracellular membrane protein CFEM domain-containing protein n=1 Tax=Leucocoprinus leucothites TaxID=201217 RepID=A0A8H5FVB3_9AGAR|nr:hypothetical protein D9756_008276 [Leucoagaricus leucothites]